MTQTTKTIFERFEVRKSRLQKTAFLEWITEVAETNGWKTAVENNNISGRNFIIGNPETAKVVFTAHYDTCAVMPIPNFITPKNVSIYILYQIVLTAVLLIPAAIVAFIAGSVNESLVTLAVDFAMIAVLLLMLCGPANKHTANDNTSGVTTVIDLMHSVPDDKRDDVAFILFDMEEQGMFGSSAYFSKHKKVMKNKLLINFDCVSDGDYILLAVRKKAKDFVPLIESSFVSDDTFTVEVATKGVFYPSDQMQFPCGVGVGAFKKKGKVLYLDRIHTKKDIVYNEENIEFLVNSSLKLIDRI